MLDRIKTYLKVAILSSWNISN